MYRRKSKEAPAALAAHWLHWVGFTEHKARGVRGAVTVALRSRTGQRGIYTRLGLRAEEAGTPPSSALRRPSRRSRLPRHPSRCPPVHAVACRRPRNPLLGRLQDPGDSHYRGTLAVFTDAGARSTHTDDHREPGRRLLSRRSPSTTSSAGCGVVGYGRSRSCDGRPQPQAKCGDGKNQIVKYLYWTCL